MSFLDLDGLTYFCSKIKSWAGSEFLGIGDTAVSAASDADGNVITETYATKTELDSYLPSSSSSYISSVSVSGTTVTFTKGDGSTSTITTQDTNTDTKVTNTLATTTKFYITGTSSSSTNTGTQYFDTGIYSSTTAGRLCASTFQATSDAKYKADRVETYRDLGSCRTYEYTFLCDGLRHVGLLAQEVRKVIPEAVSEDENGLHLEYNSVVAALVGEVNALKRRVKALEEAGNGG